MYKIKEFFNKLLEVSHYNNQDEIQRYFGEVADHLFKHVAIEAGNDAFTFVEVEFYYYKKGVFEGPLFNCTYPRTRKAGQFFWHYSGIDICFESIEKDGYFGGILIRSLKKNGGEIIAGPMRCSDELMNSCNHELPSLIEYESNQKESILSTIRYGISADKEQQEAQKLFCFYLKQDDWTRKRKNVLVADKTSGGYKTTSKKDYYSAQPDKR